MNLLRPINPGFSTADAEKPELRFESGKLYLTFVNWREEVVRVQFSEVCAFRWHQAESICAEERDDSSYEVLESAWLAEHVEQQHIDRPTVHRHLRFNFNACGQLEVICVDFAVLN